MFYLDKSYFLFYYLKCLAHTPLLIDAIYQTIDDFVEQNRAKYSSMMTAQLINILDEFASTDRKKSSIDPKPLFNCLIRRYLHVTKSYYLVFFID